MEKRDLYDEERNLTGETILKGDEIPRGHPKSGESSLHGTR